MFRSWAFGSCALLIVGFPKIAVAADAEGARSLLDDVARVVAAEEMDDWFADREALNTVGEHLLPSVCHASMAARDEAEAALRARHAELGDARRLFAERGELSDDVVAARRAERQLAALEHTLARQAECPFWIQPRPGFQGLQSDRRRLTLSLESGGDVRIRRTRSHWTFGGGGGRRLLAGWGFDGRYTLLSGVELIGGALVRPGSNASELVFNYFPAAPMVFRARRMTWHFDVETALVSMFEADNTRLSWGARLGGAFAFTALRRRNVLPWAGVAVAYEHYFEGGGRAPIHFVRGGLRIGLPWDP
jgi:hypothetical protein